MNLNFINLTCRVFFDSPLKKKKKKKLKKKEKKMDHVHKHIFMILKTITVCYLDDEMNLSVESLQKLDLNNSLS